MAMTQSTEEESQISAMQPAVHVNKFIAAADTDGLRLALLEFTAGKTFCRYAIHLNRADAIELAGLIILLCKGEGHGPDAGRKN